MCNKDDGFAWLRERGEPLYSYKVWKPLDLVMLSEFFIFIETSDRFYESSYTRFKECHTSCVGKLDRWEGSQKRSSYDM